MQDAPESLPDVPPGARPAARVILINSDQRILLLEAFEEGTDHVWWVMPGGGLLPAETFAEAAARETLEETGLAPEVSGCVWTRHHIFEAWGRSFNQFERFFVGRHLAHKWLREGERLAGVEPQVGSLWHAYRRKWATERKHLPVQDVASVGGWKCNAMVLDIYSQADDETMLLVVLGAGELREVR